MAEAFVKRGKVKEVYLTADGNYRFIFTDQISVFDKVTPSLIPRKGETLQRCSAHWFKVAENMGIRTHYLESPASNQMVVRRAGSFPLLGPKQPDYAWVNVQRNDYQIPLEVIARYYVAGSLNDRIKAGKVKPEELGYPAGTDPKSIKLGDELPEPFVEVTTKFESVDRPVPIDEAYTIAGMMPVEYEEMKEIVLQLDEEIARQVEPRGLIHADGKKEFAFDKHRNLVVIDTFGTADEDRFWGAKAYEEGRLVEISKELVRQHYRKIGYKDMLDKAREAGLPEPEIPALPQDMIERTSLTYLQLMELITGETA